MSKIHEQEDGTLNPPHSGVVNASAVKGALEDIHLVSTVFDTRAPLVTLFPLGPAIISNVHFEFVLQHYELDQKVFPRGAWVDIHSVKATFDDIKIDIECTRCQTPKKYVRATGSANPDEISLSLNEVQVA